MSREIKFRAWNRSHKHMIQDALVITRDVGQQFAYVPSAEATLDQLEWMQFTGLEDKNGREIFEGDIVALDMWHGNEHGYIGYIPEDGVIKWYQSSSAFKWFSLEEDRSDGNNYWLSQADERQREVIGNIYENPELLERAA